PKLYQMHSLRSFWSLLLPWRNAALVLYILCSVALLALGIVHWRRAKDLRLRYAMLLLGTVLVAPHLWIYDLVILAPALLLIGDWVLEHRERESAADVRLLLYSCYTLPLLGLVAQFTRVQLSVIAFAAMTLVLANHYRDISFHS